MTLDYIPLRTITREAVEDSGMSSSELKQQVLDRWTTDAVNMIPIQETYVYKIAHLIVSDYSAPIPEDFVIVQQVAARTEKFDMKCSRRERLSSFAFGTADPDVDIEVRVLCNQCGNTNCRCRRGVIEIDVDRIWELAHPEAYMKRFFRHGVVGEGSGNHSNRGKEWQLLRYAQGDFFRGKYFLSDCPNLFADHCYNAFSIEYPHIKTDFSDGEIIISYLGRRLDEDGNVMIPNHPDLISAVKSHINYMWANQMYFKNLGSPTVNAQAYLQAAEIAKSRREESFRTYRSAVTIPEFKEFRNWVQRYWEQRHINHDWDEIAHDPQNVGFFEQYSLRMGKPNIR